mgnify:CR=1 FL=1
MGARLRHIRSGRNCVRFQDELYLAFARAVQLCLRRDVGAAGDAVSWSELVAG